jgi:hypothetical protein
LRTMARITAFKPGQSPPPVKTPIRILIITPAVKLLNDLVNVDS